MNTQRELATTLAGVIHRLAQLDSTMAHVLRENLTHGELEVLVQDLAEAGSKALQLRVVQQERAKGMAV